jgi:hypothetical protein
MNHVGLFQIHVPKTEEVVDTDKQDWQKQSERNGQVVTDASTTSTTDDSTSQFLTRVSVSCATGQPYPYPFPPTPLQYFYDPTVIPVHGVSMTDALITRTEPSVQSRGTSPMTITSAASPPPDQESPELPDDIPSDQSKLITHSTISVQTSPDAEQMSEMREQSCQTSETEKEAQDESDDEREKQRNGEAVECDLVEADLESEMKRQQGFVEVVRVCDKRSTLMCCDNIFDIIGDIHKNKSNAFDTLCCASQMSNSLDNICKETEKDVLIDNSYMNLESNMASSYEVPHDTVISSEVPGHQQLAPVDGLALLSAMAEKRAVEEQMVVSGSFQKEPELFVCNTDINRNYENTTMRSPPLSSCSSPTFVFERERKDSASWSPLSGEARLFGCSKYGFIF